MATTEQPVVILGAGINGAALARELVLNGIPVILVDRADIASGTTAYSSRLIHGGLRYLEYGEFSLVRESLAERGRLLQLAPHFVRPLQIQIPIRKRGGGWLPAASKFLRGRSTSPAKDRGLWLVRAGLWMYDRYARDPHLPQHTVMRVGSPGSVPVDSVEYHWLCSYWDAQILYPERFVLALLHDAQLASQTVGVEFQVFPYHEARLDDGRVAIFPTGQTDRKPTTCIQPSAIINATGAWVDRTLEQLPVSNRRLIGGTKGSHFLTFNVTLREALGGAGLYAEAADGRPVFVLPWRDAVLVGTTDTVYDEDPAEAVATEDELSYLLEVVNQLLPQVGLQRDDIHLHYAGIRPLPYSDAKSTGAITRRHWVEEHTDCSVPLFSVVGGKLTTCRSLAEETAATVLGRLGISVAADSRNRPLPGAARSSRSSDSLEAMSPRHAVVQQLLGTESHEVLDVEDQPTCLTGTDIPVALACWMIDHEWVTSLQDLVERRLMLLYDPQLTVPCLQELANLLAKAGTIASSQISAEIDATVEHMRNHFGKRVSK